MIKYKCKTVKMRLTVGRFKSWLKSDLQCFEIKLKHIVQEEVNILLNLRFSSAVRCQFYTSYLEEMQTSLRGLRRARGEGVTEDTPKENAGKVLS